MNNQEKLNTFFAQFEHRMNIDVPRIIAETAIADYKESFILKSWDGVAWEETKKSNRKGSLMVRTGALMGSIQEKLLSPDRVVIKAGSSKVPYAQVHNEGGTITRKPRSETFQRNRFTSGKNKGKFKGGKTSGQGFTFKATSFQMPKRQFMGYSADLNRLIIKRLTAKFQK
jgi:phage gpG-like protein